MTSDQRVQAVVKFGFTERQARFLVTVMLHSGVCLLRHYTAFAHIVHGQKTRKFFAKLVRHGYATAYRCRHNRGRVYHVKHKPLYRAIGETDSRLRRPMSAARVMERLPLLDAIFACPAVVWLATSEEKQVHLSGLAGISTDEATSEPVSRPALGARDEMPLGIDLAGRWVFVYVVTGDRLEDFHGFLQRHVAVLSALPAWTLRIVFPMPNQWLRKQYEECARQELAKPWPNLIGRLKWYFEQRRQKELDRTPVDDPEKYAQEHFCFHLTRYQVLYERWLSEGEGALKVVSSEATAEAIKRGAGRVEYDDLPFRYRHLSPLLGYVPRTPKGAEEGEHGPTSPRPPLGSSIADSDSSANTPAS